MAFPDDTHIYSAARYLKSLFEQFVVLSKIQKYVESYVTTSSFAVPDDGSTKAQVSIDNYNSQPTLLAIVGNTNANNDNNTVDARLEHRYNDGSDQSKWLVTVESIAVVPNREETFFVPNAAADEYRVVVKNGRYGSNVVNTIVEVTN